MMNLSYRLTVAITVALALLLLSTQKGQASELDVSAFGILTELSVRSENERLLGSNLLFVGAGVAALGGVGSHIDSNYEAASLLSIASAVALGGGVALRYFETSTEQALYRVSSVDDPLEREQRSIDAIFLLASEQRNSRLVSGVFNAGLASYYFLGSDGDQEDYFSGTVSLLTSLVSFTFLSPAERAVKQLQASGKGQTGASKIDWRLSTTGNALTIGMSF